MPSKPTPKDKRVYMNLVEKGPVLRREFAVLNASGEELGFVRLTNRCISLRLKGERVWRQISYENLFEYLMQHGANFTDRNPRLSKT